MKNKYPDKFKEYNEKCRRTTEEFIRLAKEVHGDKYDYSKTVYVNKRTRVTIICPKHGEFYPYPNNHLRGSICLKCKKDNERISFDEFIKRAKEKHNNKYSYDKVEYVDYNTEVIITCPIHGDFPQKPKNHVLGGGCKKCRNKSISDKLKISQEEFIKKSIEKHGDNFNYDKTDLNNRDEKGRIIVTCNICGKDNVRSISSHLKGSKCIYCLNKALKTKEQFIKDARNKHGDKYSYDKVEYKGNKINVIITCPIHGDFPQTPNCHLKGQGCPHCKNSYLENKVKLFLDKHNFEYFYQKRFDWLGRQSLDFYLPKYNIAIECQGEQHFKPIKVFGGEEGFKRRLYLDELKHQLCREYNINIIYYSNKKYNENIITSLKELLCEVKKYEIK